MKINIFEGARRITKVVAAIAILCWSVFIFDEAFDSVRTPDTSTALPPGFVFDQPANYEQAMQSLRSADAAGNIEEAKKYAAIAARFKSMAEPEKPLITKTMTEGTAALAIGLAGLFMFSWLIGWIVRGFLDIPMGQDRKPEKSPP